jgi:hypothetical protein
MFYFKFKIPTMPDGSVVTYSPGWCGTRDKCAQNEKGLLYNDKELWGIGQAEGDFVPDDVEVLSEKTALKLIAEADDTDEMVFKGEKILARYIPEPEPVVEVPNEDIAQAIEAVLDGR